MMEEESKRATLVQQRPLTSDEILRIANEDAIRMYGDISQSRILICRQADGWRVEFEIDNPDVQGGGPLYLIDGKDGTILSKKYCQ